MTSRNRYSSLPLSTPSTLPDPSSVSLDTQYYWAEASDEELCNIVVRTGSRDAMEAIVRRHSPMVCKILSRWLRGSSDREEAYQATFIVLLQSIPRIRKRASLSSFVFGVAYRVAKRIRQTRLQECSRREAMTPGDVPNPDSDDAVRPFEALAMRLQLEVLDEELKLLPESLRSPIIEHYYAGRSVPQIADSMQLSVSAVEGRIKRGKMHLRSRLALRGVSISASLAAITTIPAAATASEMNQWLHLFWNTYPTNSHDPTSPDGLVSSSTLQRLVQGELIMKWSALQSPLVWSGAVAVITLLGVASIPLSLPAQGESGKVSIASANTGDAFTGDEPTTISIAQEANANSQNGVPNESGVGEPSATLDPFGPGAPQMPDKTATARTTPVPTKTTAWQVQGPLPGWLDGELDQEEMKLADALRSKLSKTKIDVQFNGIPLAAVLAQISDQIGVDVYADEKSLEGQGVAVDEPVLLHFRNQVSVRDALTLLLSPLGLTYNIRHGMIVVTSRDDEKQSVRTYDLSYILPDSSTVHELMSVIRTSVQPDVWDLGGGTSTLGVFGSMLVVNANELTHHDLERLLRELARQNRSHIQPAPPAPVPLYGPMGGMGGGMGGMFGGAM
ncbi:ECF RNA polymerase sigma factor SigE [Pirellula sp. SH-Sr6A]|uniref:RNA polymerase sigma factor n=1 Tax=Pirellula sp. SH-Sr6A TaxID=1632865 RepID=UPI00078B984D|nr:sigma-70 family RNA polymerase sigma factor [Pirellula sp. SH-Sr6A]AMV31907.1 ECF RNA polymerase sigma factor SigE [Pirellula sp. SH-Sr6A]